MTSKHDSQSNSQAGGLLSIGDQVAARRGCCQVTPERAAQLVGYIPFLEQRSATVSVATDPVAPVR